MEIGEFPVSPMTNVSKHPYGGNREGTDREIPGFAGRSEEVPRFRRALDESEIAARIISERYANPIL